MAIILTNNSEKIDKKFKKGLNYLKVLGYLKSKKVDYRDIDIIVERLVDNNILNDKYFTECFIKDKLRFTSWGPYRIINELKKHEIDSMTIDYYSYLLDDNIIYDKLSKLIDKQIKANHKLDNSKLRNKLYNNYLNLGYKSNMIVDILNDRL